MTGASPLDDQQQDGAIRADRQRELLIGRARERALLRDMLLREDAGLVTLTGPGGAGKTRLALQVASDVADAFDDGVAVVSLAQVSQPDLILPTIARVLGLEESGDQPLRVTLQTHLREKQTLLLLDNLEHLLDGTQIVTDLLAACPRLKVLATSRASLRLTGEREVPVPPLALPDLDELPGPEELSGVDSIALFLQRATAVQPDFRLTPENARDVAEICVRLDGLPLAIELAAVRLKLLPPGALARRLSSRLEVLTRGARDLPARQRTLRDTIAWSYDLLDDDQQRLLRRLAVFRGGFTLHAVEAIAPGAHSEPDSDVLDTLASLIDNSLVRRADSTGDEPRYDVLETIHEFALERLEASGEAEEVRRWHARYYLALAESAEPVMFGGNAVAWLSRLEAEHDNLRAALQWTHQYGEHELALRLAGALAWFWYDHGHLSEGRAWLERLLADAADALPRVRAKALIGAGGLAHRQYDLPAAVESLEAGLQASQEIGDDWQQALALINLGLVAHDQGDYARARRLHEESLGVCREKGYDWGVGVSLQNLSWAALFTGEYPRAREFAQEALAMRRNADDTLGTAHTLYTLGRISLEEGDFPGTRECLTGAISLFRQLGDRWGLAACLEALAIASVARSSGADGALLSARLWGAAEAMREDLGAPVTPIDRGAHMRHQAHARSLVSPDRWEESWATGRALTLTEALGDALDDRYDDAPGDATTGPAPVHSLPAGLTAREVEVLRLVSDGLSNAEVAERLYLSPRTIGQHLRSIYNKLGVNTRSAATRFAVEHRLV